MPRKRPMHAMKEIEFFDEMQALLKEYASEVYEEKEKALDKATNYLMDRLIENSPVRDPNIERLDPPGTFKESWTAEYQYKNVRYIGNTAVTENEDKYHKGHHIPLSPLIEFSSKGHPFIRRTFEESKPKIIETIKEGLKNAGTK